MRMDMCMCVTALAVIFKFCEIMKNAMMVKFKFLKLK